MSILKAEGLVGQAEQQEAPSRPGIVFFTNPYRSYNQYAHVGGASQPYADMWSQNYNYVLTQGLKSSQFHTQLAQKYPEQAPFIKKFVTGQTEYYSSREGMYALNKIITSYSTKNTFISDVDVYDSRTHKVEDELWKGLLDYPYFEQSKIGPAISVGKFFFKLVPLSCEDDINNNMFKLNDKFIDSLDIKDISSLSSEEKAVRLALITNAIDNDLPSKHPKIRAYYNELRLSLAAEITKENKATTQKLSLSERMSAAKGEQIYEAMTAYEQYKNDYQNEEHDLDIDFDKKIQEILDEIGRSNQELKYSVEKTFEKLINAHQKTAKEQKEAFENLVNYSKEQLSDIQKYVQEERQAKITQRRAQHLQQILQFSIDFAVMTGNQDLIRGSQMITLVSQTIPHLTALGTEAGAYAAMGNLAGLGISVLKIVNLLFCDPGPSFETLVLEQLQKISQQLEQLERNIVKQFYYINESLQQIHREIVNGFIDTMKEIQLSTRYLSSQLRHIDSRMILLGKKVDAIIDVVWFRSLSDVEYQLQNHFLRYENSSHLTPVAINKMLDVLVKWLLNDSQDKISTGEFLFDPKITDFSIHNEIFSSVEAQYLVGYLKAYLKHYLELDLCDEKNLINSGIWFKAARYYSFLISTLPENRAKDRDPNSHEKQSILKKGQSILAFYNTIQINYSLFSGLFSFYRLCIENVAKKYESLSAAGASMLIEKGELKNRHTLKVKNDINNEENSILDELKPEQWYVKMAPNQGTGSSYYKKDNHAMEKDAWNKAMDDFAKPFYADYLTLLSNESNDKALPQTSRSLARLCFVSSGGVDIILPLRPIFFDQDKPLKIDENFLIAEMLGIGRFHFNISIEKNGPDYAAFKIVCSFRMPTQPNIPLYTIFTEAYYPCDNPKVKGVIDVSKTKSTAPGIEPVFTSIAQPVVNKMLLIYAWNKSKVRSIQADENLPLVSKWIEEQNKDMYIELRHQSVDKFLSNELSPSSADSKKWEFIHKFVDSLEQLESIRNIMILLSQAGGFPCEQIGILDKLVGKKAIHRFLDDMLPITKKITLNAALLAHIASTDEKIQHKFFTPLSVISINLNEFMRASTAKITTPRSFIQLGLKEVLEDIENERRPQSFPRFEPESNTAPITEAESNTLVPILSPARPTYANLLGDLFDSLYFVEGSETRYETLYPIIPASYLEPKHYVDVIYQSPYEQQLNFHVYLLSQDVNSIFEALGISRTVLFTHLANLVQSTASYVRYPQQANLGTDQARNDIVYEILLKLMKEFQRWQNVSDKDREFIDQYLKMDKTLLDWISSYNSWVEDVISKEDIENMPNFEDAKIAVSIIDLCFYLEFYQRSHNTKLDLTKLFEIFNEFITLHLSTLQLVYYRRLTENAQLLEQLQNHLKSVTTLFTQMINHYYPMNASPDLFKRYMENYLRADTVNTFGVITLYHLLQDQISKKVDSYPFVIWTKTTTEANDDKRIKCVPIQPKFELAGPLSADRQNDFFQTMQSRVHILFNPFAPREISIMKMFSEAAENLSEVIDSPWNQKLLDAILAGQLFNNPDNDQVSVENALISADIRFTDANGMNALLLSALTQNIEIFSYLCQHIENKSLEYLLWSRTRTALYKSRPAITSELVKHLDIAFGYSDLSILHLVAFNQNCADFLRLVEAKMLQYTLKKQPSQKALDASSFMGVTPMMCAASTGNATFIDYFREKPFCNNIRFVADILAAYNHDALAGPVIIQEAQQRKQFMNRLENKTQQDKNELHNFEGFDPLVADPLQTNSLIACILLKKSILFRHLFVKNNTNGALINTVVPYTLPRQTCIFSEQIEQFQFSFLGLSAYLDDAILTRFLINQKLPISSAMTISEKQNVQYSLLDVALQFDRPSIFELALDENSPTTIKDILPYIASTWGVEIQKFLFSSRFYSDNKSQKKINMEPIYSLIENRDQHQTLLNLTNVEVLKQHSLLFGNSERHEYIDRRLLFIAICCYIHNEDHFRQILNLALSNHYITPNDIKIGIIFAEVGKNDHPQPNLSLSRDAMITILNETLSALEYKIHVKDVSELGLSNPLPKCLVYERLLKLNLFSIPEGYKVCFTAANDCHLKSVNSQLSLQYPHSQEDVNYPSTYLTQASGVFERLSFTKDTTPNLVKTVSKPLTKILNDIGLFNTKCHALVFTKSPARELRQETAPLEYRISGNNQNAGGNLGVTRSGLTQPFERVIAHPVEIIEHKDQANYQDTVILKRLFSLGFFNIPANHRLVYTNADQHMQISTVSDTDLAISISIGVQYKNQVAVGQGSVSIPRVVSVPLIL